MPTDTNLPFLVDPGSVEVFDLTVRQEPALVAQPRSLRLFAFAFGRDPHPGRQPNDLLILDQDERRLIVAVDDAEIVVKSGRARSGCQRGIPIDGLLLLHTEMPFADAGGGVAS